MLKKTIRQIHLWLGLASGLVVFVVSLTGTLFVFADDIIDFANNEVLHVKLIPENKPRLSTEALIKSFRQTHPERKPFYFVAYKDPLRTFKILSGDKDEIYKTSYLDPYSGKVLKTSAVHYFFFTMAHIHSELMLDDIGKNIVGIFSVIFLIQLLGGLWLWWPKKWTKAAKNTAFKLKLGARWRRVNYDLHNVLGFYSLIPALLIVATGLVVAYKPVEGFANKLFGGNAKGRMVMKKSFPTYNPDLKAVPIDTIIQRFYQADSTVKALRMSIPPKDSVAHYLSIAGSEIGIKTAHGTFALIDKYTGKKVPMPEDVHRYFEIDNMNMSLHTGYWAGWPSKIITFIVGLICTSLPVTGLVIWWGRRKKS